MRNVFQKELVKVLTFLDKRASRVYVNSGSFRIFTLRYVFGVTIAKISTYVVVFVTFIYGVIIATMFTIYSFPYFFPCGVTIAKSVPIAKSGSQ